MGRLFRYEDRPQVHLPPLTGQRNRHRRMHRLVDLMVRVADAARLEQRDRFPQAEPTYPTRTDEDRRRRQDHRTGGGGKCHQTVVDRGVVNGSIPLRETQEAR